MWWSFALECHSPLTMKPRYEIIPAEDVPHPACVMGRPLHEDEDAVCAEHPDRPAVAELFYPTRMVCAECFNTP